LPKHKFKELLEFATLNVEFSFNNEMYQQIDGVAMGSPLGPIMANIFVGAMEEKLFSHTTKPLMYFRYVDDIFAVFRNKQESVELHDQLNLLHPALKFTTENESDNNLAFLDVLVTRESGCFTTTVYRKPTFKGLYVRWDSFCAKQRKLNLVSTLVSRAIKICSPTKLNAELDNITNILSSNGYPPRVIHPIIRSTLNRSKLPKKFGPEKDPVQIHLPYIGKVSEVLEKQLTSAVYKCFGGAIKVRVLFTTKRLWSASLKDKLPITSTSNNVYKFLCQCGSWYIGRSTQRLQTRIEQHVPSFIRSKKKSNIGTPKRKKRSSITSSPKRKRTTTATKIKPKPMKTKSRTVAPPSSAIDEHLRTHPKCAAAYDDGWFTVISRGRNRFHLSILESLLISSTSPPLCRMKKFVYKLSLFFDRYGC
jgi:predicted GIY-YIG superfamily endonuclease